MHWLDDTVLMERTLKTPASVSKSPLPALTKNTAAMLSKNATDALVIMINGPSRETS